jgi:hypothetical protein
MQMDLGDVFELDLEDLTDSGGPRTLPCRRQVIDLQHHHVATYFAT